MSLLIQQDLLITLTDVFEQVTVKTLIRKCINSDKLFKHLEVCARLHIKKY